MGPVADALDMGADASVYALSLAAMGTAAAREKRLARVSGYAQLGLAFVVIWAASGAGYFWPIAGWGIALALHAWRIYGQKPISEVEINEEMHRVESPPNRTNR